MTTEMQANESLAERAFRGQRLRFSVFTSLFSKSATLAINFLALPLLFRVLGPKEFALYATLSAASGWLVYANLGIGPKLVTATAIAFTQNNRHRIQTLISSVIYPVACLSILVSASLVAYLVAGQPDLALGPNFLGQGALIRNAGIVLLLTACIQVTASVYEAVQTGYHEQGTQNLLLGAGNLGCMFALLLVVRLHPTVPSAIASLSLPLVLSRIVNIVCLRRRHPEVKPKLQYLEWPESCKMLWSGLGYSMTSVGSFLNHQLPILLVNHILPPTLTSTTATLLNLVTLAAGLVTMITIPMCASIADSVVRRDVAWIQKFLTTLFCGVTAYALIVTGLLSTVGKEVLAAAFGKQLNVNAGTLVLVGAYIVAVLVEHVLVMSLVALGHIWQTAGLYLLRGLAAADLINVAARQLGVGGVFVTLIMLTAVVTIPGYCMLLMKSIRTLRLSCNADKNVSKAPQISHAEVCSSEY